MQKPEIIVKNSSIQVHYYKFGSCPKLENVFSVFDPTRHQVNYLGLYYDENMEILYLPRGIDVWYVEKALGVKAYIEKDQYNSYDHYQDIKIKTLPRDDLQKEALRFMLGKNEYKNTATKSQLSVNLNTGKGKTYITVATFAYTGIKTMIITYATNWLLQWKEKTLEYTNLQEREICFINSSNMLFRLKRMNDQDIKQYKIFLVTHGTIKSFGDRYGWREVGEIFRKLKIGIKVFDEAHLNFTNMLMIDFYTNVYKTYYLTATDQRSDQRENQIYQTSFKNVLAIDLFDPEHDPHSDYWALLYNSRPTPQIISSCKNQYGLDRNRYISYAANNENFFEIAVIALDLAMNIMKTEGTYKDKCMIYIGTNNAIETFIEKITEVYPEMKDDIGIFTSIVDSEEKERAKNKRFIITTTKSASACVDIFGLKVVILLNEPFVSEVLARQTLGRLRDNNTYYIEVVDTGFYHCKKYYQRKKPVFNKYAKECQQTEVTDNELHARYDRIIRKLEKRIYPITFYD
ncbi:MAG: hypothetical protein PHC62_00430 [Candidatus Izemoplasmatales bacterium]|nr:hypothetical protein [Candidatus Izemoplasmatales bacterium]